MTHEELKAVVIDAIYQTFGKDEHPRLKAIMATGDFRFDEITDSSLTLIELCLLVEELTDIEIEMSELKDFPTLSLFTNYLMEKTPVA